MRPAPPPARGADRPGDRGPGLRARTARDGPRPLPRCARRASRRRRAAIARHPGRHRRDPAPTRRRHRHRAAGGATEVAEPAIAARTGRRPDRPRSGARRPGPGPVRQVRPRSTRCRPRCRSSATRRSRRSATPAPTLMFVLVVAVVAGHRERRSAARAALQRLVIGPVTDLAAAGPLGGPRRLRQRRSPRTGPPELARLARDVDAMRRQIASDLAEVEPARRQIERGQRAAASSRPRSCSAPTATWSSSPTSPRTTCRSRCARWPASASCCSGATRASSTSGPTSTSRFAVNGAQRMQRLINDLLAFSRIGRVTTRLHRGRPGPAGGRRGRPARPTLERGRGRGHLGRPAGGPRARSRCWRRWSPTSSATR